GRPSSTKQRNPALARYAAATRLLWPAPATTMSKRSGIPVHSHESSWPGNCRPAMQLDRGLDALIRNSGGLVVARLGVTGKPGDLVHVDADELAVSLHDLAGDHHRVDVVRRHAGDDRTDRVVDRH